MGIFKKEEEVVDLTRLKKRGIQLDQEKSKSPSFATFQNDFADLTKPDIKPTPPSPDPPSNPFSFLDDIAKADTPPENSIFQTTTPSTEQSDLKVKLEDLEYKLDRLVDKLALIETKLQDSENK
jgi:hypothetical protein